MMLFFFWWYNVRNWGSIERFYNVNNNNNIPPISHITSSKRKKKQHHTHQNSNPSTKKHITSKNELRTHPPKNISIFTTEKLPISESSHTHTHTQKHRYIWRMRRFRRFRRFGRTDVVSGALGPFIAVAGALTRDCFLPLATCGVNALALWRFCD